MYLPIRLIRLKEADWMRGPRLISRPIAATLLWTPAILLALNGCSARIMPAPKVPDKTVPQLAQPADPPESGEGTVVIDTTNGPATVGVSLFGSTSLTAPICATTPCAANLPYGTYNLVFKGRNDPTLESKDVLQVGRSPSVMRHTMGSAHWSYGMYIGGVIAVTTGLSIALVGVLFLDDPTRSSTSAYATLGIGGAVTAVGGWMMYAGRPEITPSSSVQWAPDGQVPAPPPSKNTGDKQHVWRLTPTGLMVSFK